MLLNSKMPTQPSLREVSERRPVMQTATPPTPQFHRPGQGPVDSVTPNGGADIGQLLAPVRAGLQRVEVKMKAVDSVIFAPLASAFLDLIGSGGKRLRPALALMAA